MTAGKKSNAGSGILRREPVPADRGSVLWERME